MEEYRFWCKLHGAKMNEEDAVKFNDEQKGQAREAISNLIQEKIHGKK